MSSPFFTNNLNNVSNKENENPHGDEKFENVKVKVIGDWFKKKNTNSTPNLSKNTSTVFTNTNINNSDNKNLMEKPRKLQSFNAYLTNDDIVDSVNEYNNEIPDTIEGIYTQDLNIMDIHEIILKKFEKRKHDELNTLYTKINSEKEKIQTTRQNIIERKESHRIIKKLKDEIDDINLNKSYNKYITRVKRIIQEYNSLGTLTNVISFQKKTTDENDILPEDEITNNKRQQLILNYIEIARKYIKLDLIRDVKEDNRCTNCGINCEKIELDEDGISICSNCGVEKLSIARARFFTDTSRTNNTDNSYEDRVNFEKVVMRFQGKQQDKPSEDLYITLRNYFITKQLPKIRTNNTELPTYLPPDIIKTQLPLNKDGEKEGTSRVLMYKALKETGNTPYYEHINLILHEIWGWALPDIFHLKDQIMEDYDKSQRVYESLPKDRKSSLNSQFRLFKHLRRLGYNCKSSSFRIPSTHDILEFHENMWAKICDILDWDNL